VLGKGNDTRESIGRGPGPIDAGSATLSVIGKEMHIEGDCGTDGRVRIEGHVTGDVTASGIELAPTGTVDGDVTLAKSSKSAQAFVIAGRVAGAVRAAQVEVQRTGHVEGGVFADEAVIHGHVHGGVVARRRLALEETAEVEGDVRARSLALKEGGRVNGTIRMGDLAAGDEAESPAPAGKPKVEVLASK
jgi:cytoskeletal protein CcmA (bactofilin family)